MTIFLAIGNSHLEEMLRQGDYDVMDSEDNLATVYDLLNYATVDGIVINRLLDSDGTQLINIAKKARLKGIKIIVLVEGFEDYEERKLITILVNLGVTAFMTFKEVTPELIYERFCHYPEEFDFDLFAKAKVEYREVVKSIFKEVITVYSPLSHGSSTVASHLAVSLAKSKNCRVCLVDYNPLKPRLEELLDTKPEHTLSDVLDAVIKGNLTTEKLEAFTKPCKYQKNLDVLFGLYDLNDYYASKTQQYEEIIGKLKFSYDYVVLDTHAWFDVLPTDAALALADRVVVPVKGTPHALEGVSRYLDMFGKYNDFDIRKFGIIINQYCGSDLTSLEITAKLKYPVLGYISYDSRYRKGNCFKNARSMNEYANLLKALGMEGKKKFLIRERVKELFKWKSESSFS